jgi:hypothetical protein
VVLILVVIGHGLTPNSLVHCFVMQTLAPPAVLTAFLNKIVIIKAHYFISELSEPEPNKCANT